MATPTQRNTKPLLQKAATQKSSSKRKIAKQEMAKNWAALWNVLGVDARKEGNYVEAVECLQLAIRLRKKSEDADTTQDLALLHNNLAIAYNGTYAHLEAVEHSKKAVELFEEAARNKGGARFSMGYHTLAESYRTASFYQRAMTYYHTALEIAEATPGSEEAQIRILHDMGDAYREQGRYTDAVRYLTQAYELQEAYPPTEGHSLMPTILLKFAWIYTYQGQYKEAMEYYHKAIQYAEKNVPANRAKLAPLYESVAIAYEVEGNQQEADNYAAKAEKLWGK